MQRRDFLKSVAAGTLISGVQPTLAEQQSDAAKAALKPDDKQRQTGGGKRNWNILVVVSDTLRTAFLGPYGNNWVKTPTLDRLAKQSAVFQRAHPGCLPTIPTRRTLHSG